MFLEQSQGSDHEHECMTDSLKKNRDVTGIYAHACQNVSLFFARGYADFPGWMFRRSETAPRFPVELIWFPRVGNWMVSNLFKKLQSAKVRKGSRHKSGQLIFWERPGCRTFWQPSYLYIQHVYIYIYVYIITSNLFWTYFAYSGCVGVHVFRAASLISRLPEQRLWKQRGWRHRHELRRLSCTMILFINIILHRQESSWWSQK